MRKKTIDSVRPKTIADRVADMEMIMNRDAWSLLGRPTHVPIKNADPIRGYGGGWVARHAPEILEKYWAEQLADHDCHHTPYGEDGCDCDRM